MQKNCLAPVSRLPSSVQSTNPRQQVAGGGVQDAAGADAGADGDPAGGFIPHLADDPGLGPVAAPLNQTPGPGRRPPGPR